MYGSMFSLILSVLLFNDVKGALNMVQPKACFTKKDPGSCTPDEKRFYYDFDKGRCLEFDFGCQGNENNFKTLADCQRFCTNVCIHPMQEGPCRAKLKAYYFDTVIGKCKEFYYGGCNPNANNFPTMDDCRRRCPDVNPICMEEEFLGNARGTDGSVIRWSFDSRIWRCGAFAFEGEVSNKNNFNSLRECEAVCPISDLCKYPVDPGPCPGKEKRWHYDYIAGKCIQFNYGGCLGNDNNFKSEEKCEMKCSSGDGDRKLEVDICSLPVAGKLKQDSKEGSDRFYFSMDTGNCLFFKYSGEGGNENNFMSVEECYLNCPTKSPCAYPKDGGEKTDRAMLRTYYDISKGRCNYFIYSGKGGNINRFTTMRECQDTCIQCSSDSDRGPCLGYQPLYFYNSTAEECQQFIYGGCRGNRNRFETVDECNRRCRY